MYIVARMVLGFGIPFCIVAASALIGELGHPKERPIMTSLFNSSYFIGQIVSASVGLGTVTITNDWAWRLPSLLQICPALIQICTILYENLSPATKKRRLTDAALYRRVHDTSSARTDMTRLTQSLPNTMPKETCPPRSSEQKWRRSRKPSNWSRKPPSKTGPTCSTPPVCVVV